MQREQKQAPRRVFVVGNGMTKFMRPGKHNFDYHDLSNVAIKRALRDAGLRFEQVEQAYVGYVYGDSASGQRAVYTMGNTGIPIFNVNNNCSTGSTALWLACKAIATNQSDCVLALGFEKMFTGSLKSFFSDRVYPLKEHLDIDKEIRGESKGPFAPRLFGNAGKEHMERYGTTKEHFAKVAVKNHKHSVNNPYSQFRDEYSLAQILKSASVHDPITKLQCCPTSDGAAAAIIVSEDFVRAHNLEAQAVEVTAITMTTDTPSSFARSSIDLVGGSMSRNAAQEAYKQAGVSPEQVDVVELHDCFSANELITYEALGLCPEGKAGEYIDRDAFTYGGKVVVNPSGGLISKGHPLGATGLAQCAELCWQLRNMAEKRQVRDAKVALQHNLGLGGACVVAIYKKMRPDLAGRARPD